MRFLANNGQQGGYCTLISPDRWEATFVSTLECGGDDETRTRDLCRDSPPFLGFTTTYKTAGTAKIRGRHIRHSFLWVGLWVEN